MTSQTSLNRIGAVGAIAGAILLLVATSLHPLEADPNDPEAAFAEYAADDLWVATHLGQFIAVVAIAVGLIAFSHTLRQGRAEAWATLGQAGAIASVVAAAALQAVDGIALKFMVDRWAMSSPPQRDLVFEAAFGVRQIEVGLASLMSIIFGLTVLAYGVALAFSSYPRWLGWIAVLAGLATVCGGVVLAYTGFSALAMAISMPASIVLLIWMVAVGTFLWRSGLADAH